MAKKKIQKYTAKTNPTSKPYVEDGEDVFELDTIKPKNQTTKPVENVKVMPQTFIEDVFDIEDSIPIIIENPIVKKTKKIITIKELRTTFQFKNKLNKIKVRIENEKSFEFLFDYAVATKMYRSHYISETQDEYDILLLDIVLLFKKHLSSISLSYELYKKIDNYFESLKTLYGRFNNSDMDKSHLIVELETARKMSNEVSYYFFK